MSILRHVTQMRLRKLKSYMICINTNSGKVWIYDDLPLVEEDQVKEYLSKLGIHYKIM